MTLNTKKVSGIFLFASILIFFFALTAEAKSFSAEYKTDNNIIELSQQAAFTVNITNFQNFSDKFRISIDDDIWAVSSDPLYAYQTQFGISIEDKESSSFKLFLKPTSNLSYGVYRVRTRIESRNTAEMQNDELYVIIKPNASFVAGYLPAVRVIVETTDNGKIDPRKPIVFSINLDNQNPLNIPNLKITVRTLNSNLISKELDSQLGPLEQRTEQVTVNLNPLEHPAKDVVEIRVMRDGEILKTFKENIEIISYSQVDKTKNIEKKFLRTETTIIVKNNANIVNNSHITEETNFFSNFFIKSVPEYEKTSEGGKSFLAWKLDLKPNEELKISVVEDYRLFVLVVFIIIISTVLYFLLRSPIVIRKDASITETEQGGISELKILIYIKNRTGKQIRSVKIVDKVHTIAEIRDEFVVGTLKPTKVLKHDKKGTIIEWEIPVLEGYEERIISYKIKSKLSILGFFNLPPAMLKYKTKTGREIAIFSNKVRAVSA